MTNNEVRKALKMNGVFLWEVGNALGVSESTVTRLMRTELTEEKKQEFLEAIQRVRREREESVD